MNWLRSLRSRLLVALVACMAVSAGLVAIGVLVLAEPFMKHMLRSGIEDYTKAIARNVRFGADGQPIGVDETRIEGWVFSSFGDEVLLRLLDANGRVTYPVGGDVEALVPQGRRFDPNLGSFTLLREGVAMHAAMVAVPNAGRQWYVQFAASDRLVLRMRKSFGTPALLQGILVTCATFFVLFLVTAHLTLRRALQPLRVASRAAKQITPRTLDARLDAVAQPVEIRPLVEAFNRALDRLQQGYRIQQEFLSSAAHELKTPLALIRVQVEFGASGERRRLLLEDVDRMARQVQQLLLLAEVSEPENFRIESIDPRPAIQEVFDYMARVGERHAVSMELRFSPGIGTWRTDRGALFTLLKNLLENAIQHSPADHLVTLFVAPSSFSVTDQGPGISRKDRSRMFERFWRGPERRDNGAGLGLAICHEIAIAHGWRIDARNAEQGLEVHVVMDDEATQGVPLARV